jgi:hypothetical protein
MMTEPGTHIPSKADTQPNWLAANLSVMTILLVALVARVLAAWGYVTSHPRNWLFSHPWEMGLVANSLVHGLGYSSPFGGSTGPTAIVAPGYPTLIAAIFVVFGSYTFASAIAILGLQILVSLLTIWLMMHVAREVFDSRTATIAGAFWAVSLPLLWMPTIFWETSISACAVVGVIALALRCQRTPTKAAWILLGSCCALAALVNPALLPSLLAIMGSVALQMREAGWKAPGLGVLVLVLVYSPWPIRNACRFHAFIPLRSTVGMEMYMGNRPGATGRRDDSLFPMINKPELASYLSKGEVKYTGDKSAQAWAYIRAQPGVFVSLSLKRVYRFWAGSGNADAPAIYEIHALFTTLLGGAGLLWLYLQHRRALAVLAALPLLLYPLPYYITHAEFRYRLDIDPLLTVLAGYAAMQMFAVLSRRRNAGSAVQMTASISS